MHEYSSNAAPAALCNLGFVNRMCLIVPHHSRQQNALTHTREHNADYKGIDHQCLSQMVVAASAGISIGNRNDGLPTLPHPHRD